MQNESGNATATNHSRRGITKFRFVTSLVFAVSLAALALSQEPPDPLKWDADQLGNHRFVLRVAKPADAVWAHIDWRRRDHNPEAKDLIVVDAHTGKQIANILRIQINRESGDLLFQPVSGAGEYYVYYLPYIGKPKSSYPKISYPGPKQTAAADWLEKLGSADPVALLARRGTFPAAEVLRYESADELDRFTEMERIATEGEVSKLLADHPGTDYFVFPEDRFHSVRMTSDIPQRWIQQGPNTSLSGSAQPGEYYSFQLGVWAARQALGDVRVAFGDLHSERAGQTLLSAAMNCINQGGIDHEGRQFVTRVNVAQGKIQTLWCGVNVPTDAKAGTYTGDVTVSATGSKSTHLKFSLEVSGTVIRNHGDDDPARLSRLRWLDSTLDQDDGIVPPYTPVVVHGNSIGILGRKLSLGIDGFPSSIQSYFDPTMTQLRETPRELLAAPIALVIDDSNGHPIPWASTRPRFLSHAEGRVVWEATNSAGPLQINVRGEMEFDGYVTYSVDVRALKETNLQDIRLEIPFHNDVARYTMGLGLKGAARPDTYDWKWEVKHNQDAAWIGDVNAGLQFGLQDDHYSRPLNTNFYLSKPLIMPASWDNGGQGGCQYRSEASAYRVRCFSGPRRMSAGEVQHYDFHLLLTPFHTINPTTQWKTRFYHAFKPVDEIAAAGANTINIHHATAINPYINYPFLRPKEMKDYIDEAHARGMKVKIYYTIRELTNHAPELFALRSLGNEVIADGPGVGGPWLQEHLEDHYIPGWHVQELADSAVVTTGISRWHNFYVEGLNWLVNNVGIDGLYLDDVAFDRATMKRVRKVLARGRPDPLIDLHSANQFDAHDGFASSANLYLEHFPYIDRLWFGEYFDYNSPPDYWLIEMSGIPFGLMGEMLQDGGNPWRGMVYGMTDRLPYSGDPRPIWKVWDSFGIQNTNMIGYWVPDSPVKTDRQDVLATVYQGNHRALVAIASWAPASVDINLVIDWKRLGISPDKARISAPAIQDFQEEKTFSSAQPISVVPGKGWLLEIEENTPQ
jgi:hypothetical protein